MGLDLFAGTLTRFYGYTWQPAAGRAMGVDVQRLFAGGEPEYMNWPREKMVAAIEEWRSAFNATLRNAGEPVSWRPPTS